LQEIATRVVGKLAANCASEGDLAFRDGEADADEEAFYPCSIRSPPDGARATRNIAKGHPRED
jgi:hypothetical protein